MGDTRVLFAASEVYPFAKSGGLADVAYSLPRVLNETYDVDVIMPLYQFIDREVFGIQEMGETFDIRMGGMTYPAMLYICEYEYMTYRFVYTPLLCDRAFLYGPPQGGYEDNDIRFALFNYAMLEILKREKYEFVHLNDWQTALLPLLLENELKIATKSLFTIHNLAYQGIFEKKALARLGIDEKYFHMDCLEFYGQVNFMKAGIAFSDRITTVSPTYAKEILTPEFGCGLEGFLQYHSSKLTGIVNGIDTEHFSPSTDKMLVTPYKDLRGKGANKNAFLKEIKMKEPQRPLIIFIGRFTWQKGLEIFIDALPEMASMACNIVVLGDGEAKYHDALEALAKKHDNIYLEFGYDEALSHRMYAASDFFLMPSLFEPCGLAQMIAMHYGSMPIVRSVGGLADTVHDHAAFDSKSQKGYGIVFAEADHHALLSAVTNALALYGMITQYNQIVKHNMLCDFSWRESGKLYIKEYETLKEES
ncbi:glycogen synthase [Sulfurovum sp. XGS-02]|uniref:glycogen synthase n=1 Tax=Sulfurovum sp. XGS-02 TaxID=2925411 RepID=UPI00205F77C6|nr:glycogen/starch synthase [Sulfurovum sp. XGS-02]UPT76648.1 glycogen synthase [Sulfurovum sp. XGS-02]